MQRSTSSEISQLELSMMTGDSAFDPSCFDCRMHFQHVWDAKSIFTFAGAVNVVNRLHQLGKRVLYVTNNSTKTREQYLEKFLRLGFTATINDIFGTAFTSALYLKHECKVGM